MVTKSHGSAAAAGKKDKGPSKRPKGIPLIELLRTYVPVGPKMATLHKTYGDSGEISCSHL
jgi:hypothetical protein